MKRSRKAAGSWGMARERADVSRAGETPLLQNLRATRIPHAAPRPAFARSQRQPPQAADEASSSGSAEKNSPSGRLTPKALRRLVRWPSRTKAVSHERSNVRLRDRPEAAGTERAPRRRWRRSVAARPSDGRHHPLVRRSTSKTESSRYASSVCPGAGTFTRPA